MNLDTRNLYLYADSASDTANLASTAVAGLNANTWLDLSNAANNKASSKTSYCLAVNNNGYTVYVNQNGPVVSCANQTAISRAAIGEARTLAAPSGTAAVSAATPAIGTPVTGSISGAANVTRQEWILPDGTSQTAASTSSLTYNSTGARTFTLRTVGTKGERVSTVTVNPQPFNVTVVVRGTKGAVGASSSAMVFGNCYFSGAYPPGYPAAGSAGSNGGRAQGTYSITSLPTTFNATFGSANAGQAGQSMDTSWNFQCQHIQYGGSGGNSGISASVAVSGVTIASAAGRGGAGGTGTSYYGAGAYPANGGAGGAQSSSTSAPGLTSAVTATDSTDSSASVRVILPNNAQVTRSANGTIMVSSSTSIS